MNKMNCYVKEAARYSLILVTQDGCKYYYDIEKQTFVAMYEKTKPYKASLPAFDMVTSIFDSREQFVQTYQIESPIRTLYLAYKHEGEIRRLSPAFDCKEFGEFAGNYRSINCRDRNRKHIVDFRYAANSQLFDEVYNELCDLNSDFCKIILNNEKKLINISMPTRNTLIGLRAHEKAIVRKNYDLYGKENDTSTDKLNYQYESDRRTFKNDLKSCLSDYREFRILYLNYRRYKASKEKAKQIEEKKNETSGPKLGKEPIRPPQQLSFFPLNN